MFKMKNIPDASLRYLRKCQARPAYVKALEAVPDIFHGGEENPIKNSKMYEACRKMCGWGPGT